MISVLKTLSYVLNGNDFCALCLKIVDEDYFNINDELYFSDNEQNIVFTQIISKLLDEDEQDCSISDKLCKDCAQKAVNSYKFIKMCLHARTILHNTIQQITDCVFDTSIAKERAKTLYIAKDMRGCTFKKYFDKHSTLSQPGRALKRFKSVKKKEEENTRKRQMKYEKSVNDYIDTDFQNEADYDSDDRSTCQRCSRTFAHSRALKEHHLRMHAPKTFKCNKCSKSYGSASLLKLHKSESHITVMCAECGKTYTNIHALKMHSFSHAKLTCPTCGRHYKTRNSYRKHVKSKFCSASDKERGTKRMHLDRKYTCDICSKSFAHKGTLQVHINFEHENGKAYACSWCGKKFPAQSRLKSHIVKHTKERNFTCDVCRGKFVTKEALLYHTRIHTGETPYACSLCDQKFLSASRRMDHVRRKHMGPTLECDVCSSKFRTPCALKKHKRRHFNPTSRLYIQNVPENVEV